LKSKQNREDKILSDQIRQAEMRAQKEFEEKERRIREMEEAIEISRQNQIKRKQIEKERETKQEKDFAEYWKVRNKELQDMEEAERQEELLRNIELERYR
jgi:LPS O-antigen subunit length determinant protein (WzzB/FepE family)